MNKQLSISLLALCLFAPASGMADTIGFEVGAGMWSQDADGTLGTDILPEASFTKGDSTNIIWAAIEHPIPVVPNLRFAAATVESSNASGDYLNIDLTDFTFYYEVLDNWANLDLGLTGRKVSGDVEIGATTDKIDITIPMLYIKAKIDIPDTGFSFGAEMNTIGVYQDLAIFAAYETSFGLGVQAGKRTQTIEFDESEVTSSLKNDGLYLAAFYNF